MQLVYSDRGCLSLSDRQCVSLTTFQGVCGALLDLPIRLYTATSDKSTWVPPGITPEFTPTFTESEDALEGLHACMHCHCICADFAAPQPLSQQSRPDHNHSSF